MNKFLGAAFIATLFWLQLSGVSFAKVVYLSDGAELQCQSFQRSNGQIVVKVNRDVILRFTPDEVNMARTFRPAMSKAHYKAHQVKRKHKGAAQSPSPAAAVPGSAAPALQAQPPAAGTVAPAVNAAAAKRQPAAPPTPPSQRVEKAGARAEATDARPAEASAPPGKEEFERRSRANAEAMAQALKNHDAEGVKKAMASQKSLVEQQHKHWGPQQNQGGPKPEPPWFKYFLMMIAAMLFTIIGMWGIFRRAGESGWKSLIPLYNMYVLMVISGKPGWWFLVTLVPGVGAVFFVMAMMALAEKFGRSAAYGVGLAFLPMFFFPMLAFGGARYGTPAEEMEFTFSEPPQA